MNATENAKIWVEELENGFLIIVDGNCNKIRCIHPDDRFVAYEYESDITIEEFMQIKSELEKINS